MRGKTFLLFLLFCGFASCRPDVKVKPYSGDKLERLEVMWIPFEHWGRFRTGFGIVKELKERGHNIVTVVSNNTVHWTERSDFRALNLTVWNVGNIFDVSSTQKNELPKKKGADALNLLVNSFLLYERELTLALLDLPGFNIHKFDVILNDVAGLVGRTVEQILDVPLVRYSTLPSSSDVLYSASYVGTVATGLGNNMNTMQRIQARLMKALYQFYIYPKFSQNYELMDEIGLGEWRRSPQYMIDSEKSPVLTVYPWGMEYAYPLPPNRIVVGPTRVFNPNELEEIPADINTWLNELSETGEQIPVIYVSMGTTGIPPVSLMHNIAITLNLLKSQENNPKNIRVIWALPVHDETTLYEIVEDLAAPSFFFMPTKWVPQSSILASEHLYAFWTHGGANSLVESVSFGKPVLCTPLFLDQSDNCRRVHDQGFGISLLPESDPATFSEGLNNLLNEKIYQENAWRVGRIIELGNGAKRSADLIEMVAEVGYDHLVPEFHFLPWYFQYDLDLLFFFTMSGVLMLSLFCMLPYTLLYCTRRLLSKTNKTKIE